MANLTGLATLRLDGNRLTVLPDSLVALTGLTWLDLSDNRFTTVPEWIGDLTGLARLYLESYSKLALKKNNPIAARNDVS